MSGLVILASVWGVGALAFFGLLLFCVLAEPETDASEWVTALMLALIWPWAVVSLGLRLTQDRRK